MITLVSYPRSGNTFLRNVLFEVYGIASSTYLKAGFGPDEGWQEATVVKTHHLPEELPHDLMQCKIVLLVRDGRDAVVSFAHHRKDVVAPESTFNQNLNEAIYAAEGSHFGGWSTHTEMWLQRADLVIHFEDLIENPIVQCERLKAFLDLPEPNIQKLPSFSSLKNGQPEYGSGKYVTTKNLASSWFRKGQVNGWKDELTDFQHTLFWHLHGEMMEQMGYSLGGDQTPFVHSKATDGKRIIIEASKLSEPFFDGIKRYVHELLKAAQVSNRSMEVDVLIDGRIVSLESALALVGQQKIIKKNRAFLTVKNILKAVLTDAAYNQLARAFPLQKLRSLSVAPHRKSAHAHYDAVLLTLPQHYEAVSKIAADKTFAVIHDTTHFTHAELHEENNARLAAEGMQWIRNNEVKCIAVSQSTANDLSDQGVDAKVIYEGVNRKVFYPINNVHLLQLVDERYQLPPNRFLLSVSTLEPRKNTIQLIEAYAALDEALRHRYHLVLAGRKGWKWENITIPEHCKDQVHFTGFVRDEHLPALYTLASGFCYISLYEGFGLPVLEAMACGTPVLVSKSSSLPELIGETGFLCDPTKKMHVIRGLEVLIARADRDVLDMDAMRQSWNFSWKRTWHETIDHLL